MNSIFTETVSYTGQAGSYKSVTVYLLQLICKFCNLSSSGFTLKVTYYFVDMYRTSETTVSSSNKIGWKYRAKISAYAANLPLGYHLVWYEGDTQVSNEATFTTGALTSNHTYTAKIADETGKIVSAAEQEKSVTVSVKTGFFDKLISFFSRLFGNDITTL